MAHLDEALRIALARVEEVGDPGLLPEPLRVVVLVHAAQGLIDNGGLPYFFGMDFPGQPDYGQFTAAYRAIGALECAGLLERALALFPFSDPHLRLDRRRAFLEREHDAQESARPGEFFRLSEALCGHAEPWRCLAGYVESHAQALGLPPDGTR